jgi:hypothetical protein
VEPANQNNLHSQWASSKWILLKAKRASTYLYHVWAQSILWIVYLNISFKKELDIYQASVSVFALISFHLLARKSNLEKLSIYSNKFFHNFHLSESRFTCPWFRASGLAQRLVFWFLQYLPICRQQTSSMRMMLQCLLIFPVSLNLGKQIGINSMNP